MTQFLLRDGRTINAAITLGSEHLYSYRRSDGTTVYCLLSAKAERLLLQLIKGKAVELNQEVSDLGKPSKLYSDSRRRVFASSCI